MSFVEGLRRAHAGRPLHCPLSSCDPLPDSAAVRSVRCYQSGRECELWCSLVNGHLLLLISRGGRELLPTGRVPDLSGSALGPSGPWFRIATPGQARVWARPCDGTLRAVKRDKMLLRLDLDVGGVFAPHGADRESNRLEIAPEVLPKLGGPVQRVWSRRAERLALLVEPRLR